MIHIIRYIFRIKNNCDIFIIVKFFFLGGKTREGYSIISFPDSGNFVDLPDKDYKKLISYITSVPSYVFFRFYK